MMNIATIETVRDLHQKINQKMFSGDLTGRDALEGDGFQVEVARSDDYGMFPVSAYTRWDSEAPESRVNFNTGWNAKGIFFPAQVIDSGDFTESDFLVPDEYLSAILMAARELEKVAGESTTNRLFLRVAVTIYTEHLVILTPVDSENGGVSIRVFGEDAVAAVSEARPEYL